MRLPRPRFRVRTLLLVTAVIATSLTFYIQHIQRQRKVVTRVLDLGGAVRYDYQKATKDRANVFDPKAAPPGPRWLRAAVGKELFEDVVMIDLQGKSITDRDLEELKKLPKLENLSLGKTQVTNAG